MDLYVGTSGYSYKEWKGTFYPEELPQKRMLHYYSERFGTVEINNTFYRMPKASVLEAWAADVPLEFRFVLKASQRITHMQRLKDAGESVAYLLEIAGTLGERLGPLLFQLPPNLKKDVPRLREFLEVLAEQRQAPEATRTEMRPPAAAQLGAPPASSSLPSPARPVRSAFEFRHETWFDDEVFALLREHQSALCIADAEDDLHVPFAGTTDWGYLRLRRPEYDDAALWTWVERVREQDWRDAFVFFKHEDAGKGPRLAGRFLELAGSREA
jgi:uncharacterized protein YecE (DUF72 family)